MPGGESEGAVFTGVLVGVVRVVEVLGILGCIANEVALHSGDGSSCIKGSDDFNGVRG